MTIVKGTRRDNKRAKRNKHAQLHIKRPVHNTSE